MSNTAFKIAYFQSIRFLVKDRRSDVSLYVSQLSHDTIGKSVELVDFNGVGVSFYSDKNFDLGKKTKAYFCVKKLFKQQRFAVEIEVVSKNESDLSGKFIYAAKIITGETVGQLGDFIRCFASNMNQNKMKKYLQYLLHLARKEEKLYAVEALSIFFDSFTDLHEKKIVSLDELSEVLERIKDQFVAKDVNILQLKNDDDINIQRLENICTKEEEGITDSYLQVCYGKQIVFVQNENDQGLTVLAPIKYQENVVGVFSIKGDWSLTAWDEMKNSSILMLFVSMLEIMLEKTGIAFDSLPHESDEIIGCSSHVRFLRDSLVSLQKYRGNIFVYGENGVGKTHFLNVLAERFKSFIHSKTVINCNVLDNEDVMSILKTLDTSQRLSILLVQNFELVNDETKKYLIQMINTNKNLIAWITMKEKEILPILNDVDSICVHIPPLRERKDDLALFVDYFLKQNGVCKLDIGPKKYGELLQHDWPRNISELKAEIEHLVIEHNQNLSKTVNN